MAMLLLLCWSLLLRLPGHVALAVHVRHSSNITSTALDGHQLSHSNPFVCMCATILDTVATGIRAA